MPKWDLFFTLPNLTPPVPTPYESEWVAVCATQDPRLNDLARNRANTTGRRMLRSFRTVRRARCAPGCLLVRTDAPPPVREAETLRAFRNICAIATITRALAAGVASPQRAQWTVQFADQFCFGYFAPGRNGWVQTLDGASRGTDTAIPAMQPTPQFGDPSDWRVTVDRPLLTRLIDCWQRCYLKGEEVPSLRRLFRSLEVAFHAAMFPADGLTSINDVGTRIALWVSACEVLCHPGKGSVSKRHIQAALRELPYGSEDLTREDYEVSHQKQVVPATLPEALYDSLYSARNKFLHGMPVERATLHYLESPDRVRLIRIAPVLYNAALLSVLQRLQISGGPMTELDLANEGRGLAEYFHSREGFGEVLDAISAAGHTYDNRGYSLRPRRRGARP